MLDRARDDQIEAMFHEALERPRAERARFIRERCPDDPSAQAEVLALLATIDRPTTGVLAGPPLTLVDEAMSQGALDASESRAAPEPLPQRIGPFRVVRLLGEGGMGRVYEAEQDNPRRMVAIKVVRPGVVSREVLRRFAHEAQILASLKHPGIAQVFQAGAIARPGGAEQPYFAMEVVRGPNLVEFALRRRLAAGEKAELLARVCDAVQHAHQKGVVHRDLKPANILVEEHDQDDSRGGATGATREQGPSFSPKILDFGIARLTDAADEALSTLRTAAGQIIGTLAYMAPEQLDADPAARPDTRCDIYALGALGYELLAGRLPINLSGRPLAEAARLIREVEPPALGAVKPELRGDLETIIAKAMDKEPARRYASAGELAADLRRHLRDEPILARPSSALYQLGKFARRNRTLVGGIAATVLTLIAGAVVSGVLAFRESAQRAQAQAEAARASLAAAAAELRTGSGASARSRLRSIPPERRGWEWRYLAKVADRSTGFLQLESGWVPSPEMRADAAWDVLITNYYADAPALAWRPGLQAAPEAFNFASHRYGMIVDPSGRTVLLFPDGETLLAVDRADGRELWRSPKTSSGWRPFSADGSLVVGYDLGASAITLRDARSGREVASLPFRTVKSGNARFAPDDSILIEDQAATLRIDRSTGAVIESYPLVDAVFPRDMRFAVGAVRSDLVGYDCARKERLYAIPDAGRWSWSMSTDGSVLVVGDPSGTLRTYDPAAGEPLALLHAHDAAIKLVSIAPDDKTIVSLDEGGGLRTFDLESAAEALASPPIEHALTPGFSPDGAMMASIGWGAAAFCDARTGAELGSVSVRAPDRPGRAAFAARSDRIVVVGWGPNARAFQAPASGRPPGLLWTAPLDHDARCAAWSDSDRRILVGCADGSLRTLDADSGAQLASESLSDAPLAQIIAAPDAGLVVVVDEPGAIRWRTGPSERWLRLQGPANPSALAFAPASGAVAIGSQDGQVVLFSPAEHRIAARAKAAGPIFGLAFLPDASRLAVASNDSVVRVLETQALREALTLPTPAGRALAVSIDDHALRIAGDAYSVISYDADPTRELSRARRLAAQARRVVDPLFERLTYSKAVLEHLAGRTDLNPTLRQAAIDAARGRGDQLNSLNSQAWGLVRDPGRARSACELALRHIEVCCQAQPDVADYQNTRAVALLRLERFPDALAAFELSDRLMRPRRPAGHPSDAAGMSLCLSKLGRPEEAQQQLQRAEAMMRSDPQLAGDADNRQLVDEARAALLKQHAGPDAPSR